MARIWIGEIEAEEALAAAKSGLDNLTKAVVTLRETVKIVGQERDEARNALLAESRQNAFREQGRQGTDKQIAALVKERDEARKEVDRLKAVLPPTARGRGIVGEGSWSVFAEKMMAERDEALAALAEARTARDAAYTHAADGWKNCYNDANTRWRHAAQERDNVTAALDGMRNDLDLARADADDLNRAISQMIAERDEAVKRLAQAEDDLCASAQEAQTYIAQRDEARAALKNVTNACAICQSQLDTAREMLDRDAGTRMRNDLDTAREMLDRESKMVLQLMATGSRLEDEVKRLKTAGRNLVEAAHKDNEELVRLQAALSGGDLATLAHERGEKIAKLEEALKIKDEMITALHTALDRESKMVLHLTAAASQAERALEVEVERKAKAVKERDDAVEELDRLQVDVGRLERLAKGRGEDRDRLLTNTMPRVDANREMDRLRAEIDRRKSASLENLDDYIKHREELKAEIDRLRLIVSTLADGGFYCKKHDSAWFHLKVANPTPNECPWCRAERVVERPALGCCEGFADETGFWGHTRDCPKIAASKAQFASWNDVKPTEAEQAECDKRAAEHTREMSRAEWYRQVQAGHCFMDGTLRNGCEGDYSCRCDCKGCEKLRAAAQVKP